MKISTIVSILISFAIFVIWLVRCIECWVIQDTNLFNFRRKKLKGRAKDIVDHDRVLKTEGEK